MNVDVLILGGGLAGLSTAHHLNAASRLSSLVVEKQATPGGTAGSVKHEGFTFDYTGHLLHLHDAYGKDFILKLLGKNVHTMTRSSWIHSKGVLTRYPFQANTFGLPQKVIDECVLGFLKTVHKPAGLPSHPSFKQWSLAQFGEGISKHFMLPYNEKLWRTPLGELTTEWQGRFVPKPKPGEVLLGALIDQQKVFGYNATFRYPKRGGIQVLPDALAGLLKPGQLKLGCPVKAVDLLRREAEIEGVGTVRFDRLVNTLPLVHFLDLVRGLPPAVKAAREKLVYNTVWNLNVGIGRADVSEKHWIYFPEKKYPFYRAGFCSNFSPALMPAGTSSMYIEIARRPWEKLDRKAMEKACVAGLKESGLLKASDKVVSSIWMPIECGYVVYDFNRTPAVDAIFAYLHKSNADSIGRYGGWKYSFMEETILDGKRAADRLAGQAVGETLSQEELQPLK
jgi:protoporphyrinogen oxidase